jgi:hypothetical protein
MKMKFPRLTISELCSEPEVVFTLYVKGDIGTEMSIQSGQFHGFDNFDVYVGDFHGNLIISDP